MHAHTPMHCVLNTGDESRLYAAFISDKRQAASFELLGRKHLEQGLNRFILYIVCRYSFFIPFLYIILF